MKIKKAFITKHYSERMSDILGHPFYNYHLRLTRDQFHDYMENGLNVKWMNDFLGDKIYYVEVVPCSTPNFTYKGVENPPDESLFLCRDDIDVDFKVFQTNYKDLPIFHLYFDEGCITKRVKKKQNAHFRVGGRNRI